MSNVLLVKYTLSNELFGNVYPLRIYPICYCFCQVQKQYAGNWFSIDHDKTNKINNKRWISQRMRCWDYKVDNTQMTEHNNKPIVTTYPLGKSVWSNIVRLCKMFPKLLWAFLLYNFWKKAICKEIESIDDCTYKDTVVGERVVPTVWYPINR